jgi:phosphatidylglycerophosphate synthase
MIGKANLSGVELEYRKTGRWILILLALFFPVMFVGLVLNDLSHSEVPLTICVAMFFVVLIYVSVWRFIAYYRLTGKYPFYWLRK